MASPKDEEWVKKFGVEIEGVTPLLHNRVSPGAMEGGVEDPDFWKERVYRTDAGKPFVPHLWIKRAMLAMCGIKKVSGERLWARVNTGVRIDPREIPLGKEPDGCDEQTVVLQKRSRIPRRSPVWDDWNLKFTLLVDDKHLDAKTLGDLLSRAGKFNGIGDFRPQKKGEYGMFKVVSLEEIR